jgi:RNase P/RNase MRP subunit p30
MSATLRIEASDPADQGVVHRFRNFAEDIYREIGSKSGVNLAAADAATSVLTLPGVQRRQLGSVRTSVLRLAKKHKLDITVSVLPAGGGAASN